MARQVASVSLQNERNLDKALSKIGNLAKIKKKKKRTYRLCKLPSLKGFSIQLLYFSLKLETLGIRRTFDFSALVVRPDHI